MAAPQKEAGPDGSSIKPVSSLLSHFENMGKDQLAPAQPAQSAQPAQPVQSSSRNTSPAPRPDRPRDPPTAVATTKEPPPIPKRPNLVPALSKENGVQRSPARPAFSPPLLTPRPVLDAPELTVDPPHSPPKGRFSSLGGSDGSFLNPDDVVKPVPIPSPTNSGRFSSRASSKDRAVTSPTTFKPPSPPPPRRSAELRRQREDVPARPSLDNSRFKRDSWRGDAPLDVARANLPDKVSPFSSPPSSGSPIEESPPALPRRPLDPKPAVPVPKPQTIQIGFAPERPPVHPATASRRREKESETNGFIRGQLTPDLTGEQRPKVPPRPKSIVFDKSGPPLEKIPPPRPPRPAPASNLAPVVIPNQKRHVSTPLQSPSPTRSGIHGRSNTVSHRNDEWSSSRRTAPPLTPVDPRSSLDVNIAPLKHTDSIGTGSTVFADASSVNRRPPHIRSGYHEIVTKSDPRHFDVSGDRVCASGHLTRVWSLRDGELLMSFAHGEGLKATSVVFKPGANVNEEGKRLWIGNNNGDLMEADIETQAVVANKPGAHGHNEVIRIFRHFNELWSLDDAGTLHVWAPHDDHVPDMNGNPTQSFRVPKGQTFSMVVDDHLWHATGKEIRIFYPTLDGKAPFQVLTRALYQESAGEITCGCLLPSSSNKVFFGHSDGKVTVYSKKDFSCLEILNVSNFKINTLQGSCGKIWAGYTNGRICVYGIDQNPWVVKKEWQAHDNALIKIIADRSGCYQLDRHQVLSLGADNTIRVWDGMLEEDWLEEEMKARDIQYCYFDTLKAMVFTWNAGASTPNSLRYSDSDATFVQNLLQSSNCPDILIFGFQELVDLEDKAATAKRFFKSSKSKKKESDQERMSHQYRDWRDFLIRSLDDYMSGTLYHLLQTIHMVGLFTCVFVKSDVRDRISNLSTAEVKRGMGGLHGNKGAIIVRFMVDDTSLCFFNCHLAAGQTQAQSRNNDIAAILDASILPTENNPSARIDSYAAGGDGSMIMDHEIVILNGDLNYRIDTMSRDTVVMAVKQGNLSKLLERDQLLVARRRKPDFKLRIFEELPITFAPTYKYDVGTDNYDTSEKKRAPAWCDRLLFHAHGQGRIKQLDYLRHEVRVSDHRPVTGKFELTVKRVKPKERAVAWIQCQQEFEDVREKEMYQEKLNYLMRVIGYDRETSKGLIEG